MSSKKVPCWKRHRKGCIIFAIEWFGLLILTTVAYFTLGRSIQDQINRALVVNPDSDMFPLWKEPPINVITKMYLFNVTNAEAWLNGADSVLKVNNKIIF